MVGHAHGIMSREILITVKCEEAVDSQNCAIGVSDRVGEHAHGAVDVPAEIQFNTRFDGIDSRIVIVILDTAKFQRVVE